MNYRDFKKGGSITVEAALTLPLFIAIILTIGFFSRILYLHEIIQHGITETANEIASVSYIYHVSGIKDLHEAVEDGLADYSASADGKIYNIKDLYSTTSEIRELILNITDNPQPQQYNPVFPDNVDADTEAIIYKYKKVVEDTKYTFENPVEELYSIMALVGETAWSQGNTYLEGLIIKQLIKKHLVSSTERDVNKRLLALGVVDGWNGLSFEKSSIFNDNDEVTIIVTYKINTFPIAIIRDLPIIQKVNLRAWMDGGKLSISDMKDEITQEARSNIPEDLVDEVIEAGFDIWSLSVFKRGREIKKLLNSNLDENFPIIDSYRDRTVEAIRSHDTRLISNEGRGFYYQLTSSIRELDEFTGRKYKGKAITPEDYSKKQLTIVVPDVEVTEEQIKSIRDAMTYGADREIIIRLVIVR
ncbi:hypothetical protein F8154_02765 [Alkaliphilus pronyensis]|uniref:Pilus assembly protein n=1 Tax=Alkaliphilus pronyensis TaxID=1482732 RepID=A0A6I0FL37_9FIRM|nr:TadE/TadG family type IV pilus assembly protein [Alkaliphilus pronyensis]KAB3537234.1 hypothetical protein F8154_02765 [Alkaliphilus pronyensis]